MKTIKRKTKRSIRDYRTLAFTLFTIAFFSFFAVRPSLTLIVELFHERTLYTQVDSQLESKIQQIITLQSDYMRLLSKKELIDQAIPATPNLGDLEALTSTNVALTNFGMSEIQLKPILSPGLQIIPVTISGRGSYDTLAQYVHVVYVLPRLLYMKNVDLGKIDVASESAGLQFSTKISAFYFIDK